MSFITKEIWHWASDSSIWLSATHLPEIQNTEADFESRKYEIHTELKLNESVLHFIYGELGFFPTIDLFATILNTQLGTFVSYRPDPNCVAVNSFLMNWGKEKFYSFPPFACLSKTLQKICQDKAKGILIAPDWPLEPFYPRLIEMYFTYYFYSSQGKKVVPTKPTITASPTSQKTITASLLSRWDSDTLTKDVEDLIINSWAENTRKQYRTYYGQWKELSTPQGVCYP